MKMPRVHLDCPQPDSGIVYFKTECGSARGTAFLATGENETHYDVVDVQKLDGAITPRISQIEDEVGSFEVVGFVVHRFDDGVSVVEACGFDFWVAPAQLEDVLQLGSGARLSVKNLTLYVHRAGERG